MVDGRGSRRRRKEVVEDKDCMSRNIRKCEGNIRVNCRSTAPPEYKSLFRWVSEITPIVLSFYLENGGGGGLRTVWENMVLEKSICYPPSKGLS